VYVFLALLLPLLSFKSAFGLLSKSVNKCSIEFNYRSEIEIQYEVIE
jgi:hypothetical protein